MILLKNQSFGPVLLDLYLELNNLTVTDTNRFINDFGADFAAWIQTEFGVTGFPNNGAQISFVSEEARMMFILKHQINNVFDNF